MVDAFAMALCVCFIAPVAILLIGLSVSISELAGKYPQLHFLTKLLAAASLAREVGHGIFRLD